MEDAVGATEQQIDMHIPANKFYPPYFASSQNLFREDLINTTLKNRAPAKKVVVLEGQAGQGKTTLALQYLVHNKHHYAWYQLGEEDRDPIFFAIALHCCIKAAVPGFSSPWTEQVIAAKEINPLDLPNFLNILLKDLDNATSGKFHIVFDDLHLLNNADHTLMLLDYIFDTSPPHIHYFLLTRYPQELQSKVLKFGRESLHIDNEGLKLSGEETHTLFNDVLDVTVTPEMAHTLQRATDGWIMGLILVGHALEGKTFQEVDATIQQFLSKGVIGDYFQEEIFLQIPTDLHYPLQLLSFLDEIPLTLAEKLCQDDMIGERLAGLVDHNFFVRRLDEDGLVYGFHHLFRQFLQEQAQKKLSPVEITATLQEAARFCTTNSRPDAALRYLLKAGDFAGMEKILQQEGMAFLANNRNVTLFAILNELSPEVLQEYGWLTLFKGLAQYDFSPETSIELLVSAREILHRQGEEVGELLATSQIILYHWIASGLLNKGAEYLPRAEELYGRVAEYLSPVEKILAARNIAAGFCYFNSDMEKARHYSAQAMALARKFGIKNFIASIMLLQGYEDFLLARRPAYRKTLEMASDLIRDPLVGAVALLGLLTLRINELEAYGEFENYFHQESMLQESVGSEVVRQTIIGPFLHIWRAGIHVAKGEPEKALLALSDVAEGGHAALNPHLRSQVLHWQAFAMSLMEEQGTEAEAVARESIELRKLCGGPYFFTMNKLLTGATFIQLQKLDEAENLLSEAIREARQLPNAYFVAASYLNRAYCRLLSQGPEAALGDLHLGLSQMRENGYLHFWSWTPKVMVPLLSLAVQENIEQEYAQKLAYQRLQCMFLEDGTEIPLLKIYFLGTFAVEISGNQVLASKDFSPAQRQLFALLLSSPDLSISQEKVQLIMWPDSPPDKARSKFDTLLSRLRKIISKAISPHSDKNYLYMKKGLLCLDHCWVDAVAFRKKLKKGLRQVSRREFWHAGNNFYSAMGLWNGCFASDIFGDDLVQDYCLDVRQLMVNASKKWGKNLAEIGSADKAIKIIERALKYDPADSSLVQMLYHLHLSQGNKVRAQKLINHFEKRLIDDEFSTEEIEELLLRVQSSREIR